VIKKLLLVIVLLAVSLAVALISRTLRFGSKQVADATRVEIPVAAEAAVRRIAGALRFETVSYQDRSRTDSSAFRALHAYLEETYPRVHAELERETVSGLSLLYRWEGRDADAQPVLLMGHLDVVPVIPGTEDDWSYPPFGGDVAEGFVWGRGAMDDKSTVLAILEAVESLLASEFRPARTVYVAFGHDEEVGGFDGARVIAERLAAGAVDLAFVLDEGGAITQGMIPGLTQPTAIIGIAEKGYVSLRLTVEGAGGHSSMPPRQTNVGVLSAAITRLEANPFPARIDGATRLMLDYIGPEMTFGRRFVMANLWFFGPLVRRGMLGSQESAASVRTTTAATMFSAGVKDNVLPISASAVVNFRILPGETVESVVERVRDIVDDDRVEIQMINDFGVDPSPVSDPTSPAFRLIERTIRQVTPYDDLIVAPYLVVGGTDAKYYADKSANVFRFLPVFVESGDLGRVHGTDERLAIEGFATSIRFFHQLLSSLEQL
jgi:carboxypeptidase PM20D1